LRKIGGIEVGGEISKTEAKITQEKAKESASAKVHFIHHENWRAPRKVWDGAARGGKKTTYPWGIMSMIKKATARGI